MNYIKSYNYQLVYDEFFDHYFEKLPNSIKEEFYSLNENFFNKLKKRFPKAAKVSNVLSDKAEKALYSVIKKAKDATNFVKKIVSNISNFFKKNINVLTDKAKVLIAKSNFKSNIEKVIKNDKDNLISDIKTGREVANWYKNNFTEILTQLLTKNLTNHFKSEVKPISESNVIATLVHSLENIPPFSWLHQIKEAGEKGAKQLIKVLSKLTKKLGGPSFELPVMASLLGVMFEQLIKNAVGTPLVNLLGGPTSPFGASIMGLKNIALFIAFIVAIDSVIGKQILGEH